MCDGGLIVSKINIYAVSDSVGDTGLQVIKSITTQFSDVDFKIRRFGNIITKNSIDKIFEIIDDSKENLIFYTFVEPELKEYMNQVANEHHVRVIDIIGAGLKAISDITGESPASEIGRVRKTDDEYFKRIKAIEFAVRYDDGQDPEGVLKADLTIIGVSRTSKTPLSMYLANKGYKVANIPIFPENQPPKELFEVPASRVIGLTNSVHFLNQIRKERLRSYGMSRRSKYADKARILEELQYGEEIMKKIGCIKINVENKAIEETAAEILDYLEKIN